MREPAVSRCSVPVLYICRDVNDIARKHLYGRLALFLIPAFSCYADQHLPAAFSRMMNVPVVAASRLESDIAERYLLLGYRSQIAVADEVLGVCGVRLADGEYHFPLESGLTVRIRRFLFDNTQRLDGGREADVGQALDDGGGQGFGGVAGGDVAVIVGVELTLGFQGGQDAVAEQFAGPQVECSAAVDIAEEIVREEPLHVLAEAMPPG